jgi:hypothetical protein
MSWKSAMHWLKSKLAMEILLLLLLQAGRTKHRSKRRERGQKRRFYKEWGKGIRMTTSNKASAFSRLPNSTIFCPITPLQRREPNDPLHPLVGGFRITNGIRTNFEMPIVQINRQNPHKSACKRMLDRNPCPTNLGTLIILRERQCLSYPKMFCPLLLSGKLPSGQDSLGCALTLHMSCRAG